MTLLADTLISDSKYKLLRLHDIYKLRLHHIYKLRLHYVYTSQDDKIMYTVYLNYVYLNYTYYINILEDAYGC